LITQQSIETVIDTARIEDVVRDFVDLKQRGANLIGLCPFHKEKTPSFSVSPSKNIFKCFGCGKGGTPVHFLMEAEQLSFPEAIRELAKKYQITLEETGYHDTSNQSNQEKESLYILNQYALNYYKSILWNDPRGQSIALDYFKQRGFLESTIEKFDLGFAPDEANALTTSAQLHGYKIEFLQKLGLSNAHNNDFFRNRVIFPIHNLTGKTIAFAGRNLVSNSNSPKYINSPETELYNKSKTLYGLHLAKRKIREKNFAILVEGYTDVMALHQAGFENAVASSGTSLTEDQIHLIKRITSNITILYDGDAAGVKAASRGIDLIIHEGLDVKIALIPDKEDPDSYIRKVGTEAFETFLVEEATDFILFKINLHNKESGNNPLKKSIAAKDIIQSIAKIEDPIKRSIYLKETADKLELEEIHVIESCNKIIKEEFKNKALRDRRQALDRDQKLIQELQEDHILPIHSQHIDKAPDEVQEMDICRVLMLWGDKWYDQNAGVSFAHYIIDNISDTLPFFENDLIKQIIMEVTELLHSGTIPGTSHFISHEDKRIANLALEFTMSKYEYSDNWSERWGIYLSTQNLPDENFQSDVTNSILRFKLKKYNRAILEFERKIKQSNLDDFNLDLELRSLQHLVNQRNYIAGILRTVVI
jgi:DNA primase